MKIGIPYWGNVWIPVQSIFDEIGLEPVVIRPDKRTLELGAELAPEYSCVPLKMNMGSYRQALDAGAEILLMPGGCARCPLGLFHTLDAEILAEAGYVFTPVRLNPSGSNWVLEIIKLAQKRKWWRLLPGLRLAWRKLQLLEELRKNRLTYGGVMRQMEEEYYHTLLRELEIRHEWEDLERLSWEIDALWAIVKGRQSELEGTDRLKVGLIGNFYMLSESALNGGVEPFLLNRGVIVKTPTAHEEWVKEHLLLRHRAETKERELEQYAAPYLTGNTDGVRAKLVGWTGKFAAEGMDGIIQILPADCALKQELIAAVERAANLAGVPTLTMSVSGNEDPLGILVRLEAFVELMHERKNLEENLNSSAVVW